jgi:prepilin-type N-terminal cleavage/methylation domain-containing protein
VTPAPINFRRRRRAFTLLEVLMVLALLGLMAGLFITAARSFTDEGTRTPEDVFWQMVRDSRKRALLTGRPVQVRYAAPSKDDAAALVMTADGLEERLSFTAKDDVKLDFLSTEKSRSSILVAGQMVETQTLSSVTFYGDGTCSPFRVQIRTSAIAVRSLAIDPWTCAEVLTPTTDARR